METLRPISPQDTHFGEFAESRTLDPCQSLKAFCCRRLVPPASHLVDEQHGLIADHVARAERHENAGAIDLLPIQIYGDLRVPTWHLLRDRVAAGREPADLGVGG